MGPTFHVLHTAKIVVTGGRAKGVARSSDGVLDLRLSNPGSARIGTNPEQLLAAAWAASFESAVALAAHKRHVSPPADMCIAIDIDLNADRDGRGFLAVRFAVSLPDLSRDVAQDLIAAAQTLCPYWRATAGNIAVTITLV